MQKDYSNPDPIREEHESESRWEPTRRRQHFFTAALILFAACLVGICWYAYPF